MGADSVSMYPAVEVEAVRNAQVKKGEVVRDDRSAFPVVGIGGSSGSLKAMYSLLAHLPTDLGLAYLFATHIEQGGGTDLMQLLQSRTAMPVHLIENGSRISPDRIHLCPPGFSVAVVSGTFTLRAQDSTIVRAQRPIDALFTALASEYQNNAIGIVLSGGGDDGTAGLRAIKSQDGFTICQDASAQDNTMPQSAHDAGAVDMVLKPEEIGPRLAEMVNRLYPTGQVQVPGKHENELRRIINYLLEERGVDFTQYKETTIHRRIIRRMVLSRSAQLADYMELLKSTPSEVETLFNDLLINVTAFFRDPIFFNALKEHVLPQLFKGRSSNDPLRIWVPACSGGEEVVSIAIVLLEFLSDRSISTPVQIFATDLNERTIEKARLGVYKKSMVQDVDPERMKKFFVPVDGHFQVIKTIRDMCVFARHDLLKDPPFSKLDLISCQNVLIYLENEAQGRVLRSFHYGLKPTGFMALGRSETTASAIELFIQPDRKFRVFEKKVLSDEHPPLEVPFRSSLHDPVIAQAGRMPSPSSRVITDLSRDVELLLLHRYVPSGALVTKDLDIIRFIGPSSHFLGPRAGKASLNLLKMVRDDLVLEVRSVLRKAQKEGRTVSKAGINIQEGARTLEVHLEVVPLGAGKEQKYLVLFKEVESTSQRKDDPRTPAKGLNAKDQRIVQLEMELREARDQMRAITEESELTMQELQTANEEVVSSNEELQSINEELETSKEELQSINEEYATINEELQLRNGSLAESEERLRQAARTGKVGIWDRDIISGKIIWSDALYHIHGVDQQQFKVNAASFLSLVHPDDRASIQLIFEKAEQSDSPVSAEFRSIRPDGSEIWLYIDATVLRVKGKPVRMLGATIDITERKLFEQELLQRTRALEAMNRIGNTLIAELDTRKIVQAVTDAGREVTGAAVAAFFNKNKDQEREGHELHALSGISKEAFANYPLTKITQLLGPLVDDAKALRSGDVLKDGRYELKGRDPGALDEHLVRSYMTVPVISRNGSVLGGLIFGHPQPDRFTQEQESMVNGLAAQAALAIDNADLHIAVQRELQEQQRVEVALRDSEERYRSLLESLPAGVFTCDREGRVLLYNKAAETIWGQAPDSAPGSWHGGFKQFTVDGLEMDPADSPMAHAVAEKISIHDEVIFERPDGSRCNVLVHPEPMFDLQGEVIGAQNVMIDITEKLKVQELFRASEGRMRLATQATGVGIWEWNLTTGEMHWDIQMFKIYGAESTSDGVVPYSMWSKALLADDLKKNEDLLQKTLKDGGESHREFRIKRYSDGEVRFISGSEVLRRNDAGDPEWVVGTNLDITDEKNAERVLAESEQRFHLLADTMPQLAWIADANGDIHWYNKRWFEYTGTTLEQNKGWGWRAVHHPDHIDRMEPKWRDHLQKGLPWEDTFPLRSADGEYRWFLSRAYPVMDVEGNVQRWFGTNTDITDQRELSEKLMQADLHKDHFLATLAHELRSPLAPLKNGLQLMEIAPDDVEVQRDTHAMMVRQLNHLVRLVDDLMDVSRISRGKILLNKQPMDLRDSIHLALESTKPFFEHHQHELRIRICDEKLIVNADMARLTQVFVNLLTNAAKYTDDHGTIELTVNAEGKNAVIEVRDNGVGIDPDSIVHVFEMFAQVNDQQKVQAGGGLGIGLNIVKRLVEKHQGTVEVQSEGAGKGSVFTIQLPLYEGALTTIDPTMNDGDIAETKKNGPYRILVVDDNLDAAFTMSLLLKRRGHEVFTAHDGEKAVAVAEEVLPQIVFMDIGMPKKNGHEACADIRATEWGKNMHIIALSGWGQDDDKSRSKDAGFDQHVVKPINKATLERIVEEIRVR